MEPSLYFGRGGSAQRDLGVDSLLERYDVEAQREESSQGGVTASGYGPVVRSSSRSGR